MYACIFKNYMHQCMYTITKYSEPCFSNQNITIFLFVLLSLQFAGKHRKIHSLGNSENFSFSGSGWSYYLLPINTLVTSVLPLHGISVIMHSVEFRYRKKMDLAEKMPLLFVSNSLLSCAQQLHTIVVGNPNLSFPFPSNNAY